MNVHNYQMVSEAATDWWCQLAQSSTNKFKIIIPSFVFDTSAIVWASVGRFLPPDSFEDSFIRRARAAVYYCRADSGGNGAR